MMHRLREARQIAGELLSAHHDLRGLQLLSQLPGAYVPWTLWGMRPSGVVTILNDVVINDRRRIIECGPGVSTIYLARLFRHRDGHVYTVEHDERWAEIVQAGIDAEGLTEHVTIVHAPLTAGSYELPWYDEAVVEPLRRDHGPFDLLIVDGPPANKRELSEARYPALPHFAPALIPTATVVLDDARRDGERRVLGRWQAETPWRFQRLRRSGGIAMAAPSVFEA